MDFETFPLRSYAFEACQAVRHLHWGQARHHGGEFYEGEGVTRGAGLCHGAHVPFISPQDHARNRLLHALYAPRKRVSSTLRPLCGHRYARNWI